MRRPIENNSSAGQAVYEPFCGSGTTIIAAEMTGRCCHAIELNPAYVDVAVLRWQAFAGSVGNSGGRRSKLCRCSCTARGWRTMTWISHQPPGGPHSLQPFGRKPVPSLALKNREIGKGVSAAGRGKELQNTRAFARRIGMRRYEPKRSTNSGAGTDMTGRFGRLAGGGPKL